MYLIWYTYIYISIYYYILRFWFGCSIHDLFVDLIWLYHGCTPVSKGYIISACLKSKKHSQVMTFSLAQLDPPAQLGVLTRRFQKGSIKLVAERWSHLFLYFWDLLRASHWTTIAISSQHRNPSIDGSKKQRRSWQKRRDAFNGAEQWCHGQPCAKWKVSKVILLYMLLRWFTWLEQNDTLYLAMLGKPSWYRIIIYF